MSVSDEKTRLRAQMRARRAALSAANPLFAERLAGFAGELDLAPSAILGGYCALPGEADPARLLATLHARGYGLALPRVAAPGAPLVFHAYRPCDRLAQGAFGVHEPLPQAPLAVPGLLLVPLVAFDSQGRRLGYGGGYYDRTLAGLRATAPIRAIGIAFAGQEVETLPAGPFDQALDGVLTERGLRLFPGRLA